MSKVLASAFLRMATLYSHVVLAQLQANSLQGLCKLRPVSIKMKRNGEAFVSRLKVGSRKKWNGKEQQRRSVARFYYSSLMLALKHLLIIVYGW